MKQFHIFLVALVLFSACKKKVEKTADIEAQSNPDFVVAFGSCNMSQEQNLFWDDILAENPDVWIWGGDIVYADTDDVERLKSIYAMQDTVAGYAKLRNEVPVIGTWDDHDFGLNDGGADFAIKSESQQVFLDFMGVPKDSERRTQEGVYTSHEYEVPAGKIKVIVLDTRYFRSELIKDEDSKKRYKPTMDSTATVLGEAQWQWLENELKGSDADFNLIMSSIQVLSGEHGFETWGNFPLEVKKLENIIVKSGAKGVIILSGDRHISEFSRADVVGLSYPLVDFTSSGLTHSYSSFSGEPNQYRVGEVVSDKSYGVITFDFDKKEADMKMKGDNGVLLQELKQRY
ncbi:alkaline phosphatase D family protein [Flagellimonas profundi]|uniref:Alkaline phosphatase family protein n=1 Tax=Flagellimonas profundi TaxID=2915620 RepID=A0ABS3FEP6_9FLAO|nr:alkaline phosphatase D family protein [Allomuricauda profundi]MBD3623024.1 alkaline phosphatase family protein [Sunxiuqinia sp.]MBO0341592.1 alkaline phosphatase family protein [Allomuricauda profundi]